MTYKSLTLVATILLVISAFIGIRQLEFATIPTNIAEINARPMIRRQPRDFLNTQTEAAAFQLPTPASRNLNTVLPNKSLPALPSRATASTETELGSRWFSSLSSQLSATEGISEETSDSADLEPLPAIQLSEEVKLPAVIIALYRAQNDPNKKIPQPVAAAMQGVIDQFYQDLAVNIRKPVSRPTHPKRPDTLPSPYQAPITDTEITEASPVPDTVIIMPGPVVDQARDRANNNYRLLFGDDAYNQMTLGALQESQLPLEATNEGN